MALPAPSSPGGCSAPDPPLQPRSVLGRPILQGVSPGHSNQPSAPEHGVSQHRVTDWGAGRASKCRSLCPLHIGTKAVSSCFVAISLHSRCGQRVRGGILVQFPLMSPGRSRSAPETPAQTRPQEWSFQCLPLKRQRDRPGAFGARVTVLQKRPEGSFLHS